MEITQIKEAVCDEFGIRPEALDSRTRRKSVAIPRHLFFRIVKIYKSELSLKELGGLFNPARHHSTVLHSLATASDLIFTGYVRRQYYNILLNLGMPEPEALNECTKVYEVRHAG